MDLDEIYHMFDLDDSMIDFFYTGLKRVDKNVFFTVNDMMIVQLTQDKWMICDDDDETRDILSKYVFSTEQYAKTNMYIEVNGKTKRTSKYFHQLYLEYGADQVADHINRNRFDNRHENLRITTQQENMRNLTKQSNNTSGLTGVSYRKQGDLWRANIYDNEGKNITKSFSCKKYGDEEAKQMAIDWRKQKEEELGYIGE